MLRRENFTEQSIKMIIDQKIEESSHLEFKRSESLDRKPKIKDELSKDISAFANSDGGIVIYGLEEKNHIPIGFSFINGNEFSKEWLEDVIDSNIYPKIQGLIIYPIRINNNILNTIYVVKVPKSKNSPHMAKGNRYYRRYNFKSVPMEEYEIRNLYLKSEQTSLAIENVIVSGAGNAKQHNKLKWINYNIDFQIKNLSNSIEKLYKLEIHVPSSLVMRSGISIQLNNALIRSENGIDVYSVPNESPLFQDELTTVWTIPIEINNQKMYSFNDYKIDIKLYFSSGIDEKSICLKDILLYDEKPLTIDDFIN